MTTRRDGGVNLPSWNTVVEPNQDIVSGQLSMDTYAVNLGKVVQGDTAMPFVYRDPRAFFEATYLTTQLQSILFDVLSVLVGRSGDRVLQLRTPFGGGKTHTLLSLYHITKSRADVRDIPGLENLPDPGTVNVAVFSGGETGAIDTSRTLRPKTLWGEIALQLAGPEGYNSIYEQDKQMVAPGGTVISQLLGDKPALILLDEVLSFVENAKAVGVGESNLGSQTIIFLQRLTEAVAASPRAALVYSLQDSREEAGGNEELLRILGKIVERVNINREPVSGDEVLRVVQRRLFSKLGDDVQHQIVANVYADSYKNYLLAGGTTPTEAEYQREQLRNRILSSYPFHPALLDLMSQRWNSLPSYQRTRGALRFLATVVYALWRESTPTSLIGPGDVPLTDEQVRTTFLGQVGERAQYDAVIDADILGPQAGVRSVDERLARETPRLRVYAPGKRLATAALLYSFDGRPHEIRGVFENELLGVCLVPNGLDRNVLQTTFHDLNDKLLYLHQRERRYRFETQPNLNKIIMDENQRRTAEEIDVRLRSEFGSAIQGKPELLSGKRVTQDRDAIVWPNDTEAVRDRINEFQIVYLSPKWLDEYVSSVAQERGMRLYIDQYGDRPRSYHNGLALAVPNRRMVEEALNAVRLVLTLELLQSQVKQFQITPQQEADLIDRKNRAEGELKGAFSHMYPMVYTPQKSEQTNQVYKFDQLDVLSNSPNPTAPVHTRIKDALRGRVVFETVQPSKIATLTRLNDQTSLERQYFSVSDLVAGFFSYYDWTHIWNENVVRQAIVQGIKNRTFAYVANARKDNQGNLTLNNPAAVSIQFGKDVSADELDMGEGAYLLSALYAMELLKPPALLSMPPVTEPTAQTTPITVPANNVPEQEKPRYTSPSGTAGIVNEQPFSSSVPPTPVSAGQDGQRYRLHMKVNAQQFFDVMQALERLSGRSVEMDIVVTAVANPGQAFTWNALHNLVVEPMVEGSDVDVLEERVEE